MMQVLLYWLNSKGVLACDLSKKEVCDHKYVAIFSKKGGANVCTKNRSMVDGRHTSWLLLLVELGLISKLLGIL